MKVVQSCLTLCHPRDYTVHGILQARILEWVAVPFSRGSSQPRVSCIAGRFFYQLSYQGNSYFVFYSCLFLSFLSFSILDWLNFLQAIILLLLFQFLYVIITLKIFITHSYEQNLNLISICLPVPGVIHEAYIALTFPPHRYYS